MTTEVESPAAEPAAAPTETPEATPAPDADTVAEDAAIRDDAYAAIDDWIGGDEEAEEEPPPEPEPEPTEAEAPAPEPEEDAKAAEEEPAQGPEDDDVIQTLRKQREERLAKEREKQEAEAAAKRTADMEAELKQLRSRIQEIEADPTKVIQTREQYEALTARLLGQDPAPPKEQPKESQEESEESKRIKALELQVRREQATKVEDRFKKHTSDTEKYPLLARLPADERLALGLDMSRAAGDPSLDDATLAEYAEKHLQQLVRKLTATPTEEGQDPAEEADPPKDERPRRGRGGKTLTKAQAAETSVGATNPEDADRVAAERLADEFLRALPH